MNLEVETQAFRQHSVNVHQSGEVLWMVILTAGEKAVFVFQHKLAKAQCIVPDIEKECPQSFTSTVIVVLVL